jgi:Ribosomal protein L11 methyltransferase (PrmA)
MAFASELADSPPHVTQATPEGPPNGTTATSIPHWHFAMLNDAIRNTQYRAAIAAAVRANDAVLDIGSGTGLLAMIAADHGARPVVSCEAVEHLARAAERIVAINGKSGQVTVLPKHSTDLVLGVDLVEPVDVVLTEIVDYDLVGEGILPAVRHARAGLLRPGGTIIPAAARIIAVPVHSESLHQLNHVTTACGYDVSLFNAFANPAPLPVWLDRHDHDFLAAPATAVSFDFQHDDLLPGERSVDLLVTASGVCHGVAFWFELDLDSTHSLSNSPGPPSTHWPQAFCCFTSPVKLTAGDRKRLTGRWTDSTIFFELPSSLSSS